MLLVKRGYTVEKNNGLPFPYMPMQMTNIAYIVVLTKAISNFESFL